VSRPRDVRRQGSPPGRRPVLQTSRVEFNSRALHDAQLKCVGCDPGSGGAPNAASGVRLLDDLPGTARESAANGGKRGPNPRDVAQARGVRFFRSPPPARSTSGEVAALSKRRGGIETRARHHHLFVQAARTPRSHRGNAGSSPAQVATPLPPANGSRPALRTQASEVRVLSGVPTPASSGKPGALMRRAEMVRLHPPVRVGRRRACPSEPIPFGDFGTDTPPCHPRRRRRPHRGGFGTLPGSRLLRRDAHAGFAQRSATPPGPEPREFDSPRFLPRRDRQAASRRSAKPVTRVRIPLSSPQPRARLSERIGPGLPHRRGEFDSRIVLQAEGRRGCWLLRRDWGSRRSSGRAAAEHVPLKRCWRRAGPVNRRTRFDSARGLHSRMADWSRRSPVKRDEAGSIPAPGAVRPRRAGSPPRLLIGRLRVRILPGAPHRRRSERTWARENCQRGARVAGSNPAGGTFCSRTHLVRRAGCLPAERSSILPVGADGSGQSRRRFQRDRGEKANTAGLEPAPRVGFAGSTPADRTAGDVVKR
jgi:hypothetical protein